MGHSHGHAGRDETPTPRHVQRRLTLAIAPFAAATIVGLWLLWPPAEPLDISAPQAAETFRATVTRVEETSCEGLAEGESFACFAVTARLDSGPDQGDTAEFDYAGGRTSRRISEGDRVLMAPAQIEGSGPQYFFVDFERSRPLMLLAVLFAAAVVALSRWRGLAALGGLALSIVVLVQFVLPAILEGSSPILVAITGASAIMFASLYLAHGVNARTSAAVLGTLASLAITGLLAILFVEAARFTGLASEEAAFLQVSADRVNLEGLLLGGIIIGTLGVLDDVTVTQASAVWELHGANPTLGFAGLYRRAIRIGRDHIASTVNTLVLAYAGASLPLLILFSISNRSLGSILTSEIIAEELVRTLVGSIGLVSSVPITTAFAAAVVGGSSSDRPAGETPRKPTPAPARRKKAVEKEKPEFRVPKAEREWRE